MDEFSAAGRVPWRTDDVPYLREILEVLTDPQVHRVVVMKCVQIGYTQGVIANLLGYHIHQRPRPMMVVQPSNDDAKAFSKTKFMPVVLATPVLRELVTETKARNSADADTILNKLFPGGFLKMVGGESGKGLRRDSVGVVALDELDGMNPLGAGADGDQVALTLARTESFYDWLQLMGSTPLLAPTSRIWKAYKASDQRQRYLPCPHCGLMQVLEWGDRDTPYGMKFAFTKVNGRRVLEKGSVVYCCRGCACAIEENQKREMDRRGDWRAQAEFTDTAGFHLQFFYSPFPGAGWEKVAQEYLDAVDDEQKMQVWVNNRLGLPYEGKAQKVEANSLQNRAEKLAAEVPNFVGKLVCGVDTQDTWLEIVVKGYGEGEESVVVHHEQVLGSPGKEEVWQRLTAILNKDWKHESGATLRIEACCIDAGGHFADSVHAFVAGKEARGIWAVRGSKYPGRPIAQRPAQAKVNKKAGVRVIQVGTDTAKELIYTRLNIAAPGPGYMRFPDWLSESYFKGLTLETRTAHWHRGQVVFRWVNPPHGRNEPLDCEVYALAALHLLGRKTIKALGDWARKVQKEGEEIRARAAAVAAPAVPGARKTGRGGGARKAGGRVIGVSR